MDKSTVQAEIRDIHSQLADLRQTMPYWDDGDEDCWNKLTKRLAELQLAMRLSLMKTVVGKA
jgi:hypothetical protein